MLEDPTAWHYSLGVGASVGAPAGTIYPLFAGLERSGWLESRWDDNETNGFRRRLYRLTGTGQRCAIAALSEREERATKTRRGFGFGLPRARAEFG
ncbi:MAG: PadR family transcriptional regulator [Thermoleophilia bacterium]